MRDLSSGGGCRKTGTAVAAAVAFLEGRKDDDKCLRNVSNQCRDIAASATAASGAANVVIKVQGVQEQKVVAGVGSGLKDSKDQDNTPSATEMNAEKRRKLELNRFRPFSSSSAFGSERGKEKAQETVELQLDAEDADYMQMTAEDVRKFLAESIMTIENASKEAGIGMDAGMQTSGEYVISDDFEDGSSEDDNEDGLKSDDSGSDCNSTSDSCEFFNGNVAHKGLATIDEEVLYVASDTENLPLFQCSELSRNKETGNKKEEASSEEDDVLYGRKIEAKNRYATAPATTSREQKFIQDEKKLKAVRNSACSAAGEKSLKPSGGDKKAWSLKSHNAEHQYYENNEQNASSNSETSSSDSETSTLSSSLEKNYAKEGFANNANSSQSFLNKQISASTRCNGDFQWLAKSKTPAAALSAKPPLMGGVRERTPRRHKSPVESGNIQQSTAGGSLDRPLRRRSGRQERDQKARSSHMKSPPRLDDFIPHPPPSGCCCCNGPFDYYDNFHRRHERLDPMRYGSNPMLMEQKRGSHPNLYDGGGCVQPYHVPPHPLAHFYYYGDPLRASYHPFNSAPKLPDQDERFRKVQSERDNLQLQVQVLSEQIDAQNEKITDLEKSLNEKKQLLISAEDGLQRELLARSSLETQKLELMSAISELKLQQASLERDNLELRKYQHLSNGDMRKHLSRMSPQPTSSTPNIHPASMNSRKSPSPSPVLAGSPRRSDLESPKTPPANYRRQIVELQYASLPRQQFLSNGSAALSVVDANANPAAAQGGSGAKKGVAFGMGLSSLLGVRAKGHSVPNLAETEKIVIGESCNEIPLSPSLQLNKKKGLNKLFGKIRRSNSGTLEDFSSSVGEFQRGGVRATASARLGWSDPATSLPKPNKPFSEWDTENVCDWLQDLGLDQYIPEARRWVKSGQQLQESNINVIEKELAIKNPLHRKKLQLALIDTEVNGSSDIHLSQAGKLDTAWVLRWLDDTGLPQHKESFLINRVDGRVLHRLTMDDLGLLHVTSLLHVASLKRGIQVLRENNFEPACLQRRSLPDDSEQPMPKQISLWTTHRVMEWLRAVDLSEYAPNLRGAGVHGGLMVLENKFNAELLASLLNIPPGKTLLRRHLNTHFKELLGKDIIQKKREAESILGYIPLTPTSKLKVSKKSHFSLKRNKSKSEADYGDLVCPLDEISGQETNQQQNGLCATTSNNMGTTKTKKQDEVVWDRLADEESSLSSNSSPVLEHRVKKV